MNKKNIIKQIFNALILLILIIFHFGYLINFDWWSGKFNLIFIFIFLMIILTNLKSSFIWLIITGIIMDTLVFNHYSQFLLSLIFAFLLTYLVYRSFLGQKNYISITALNIIYTTTIFIVLLLFNLENWQNYLINYGWHLLFSSIIILLFFIIKDIFFSNFKKNFILKNG